MITHIVDKGIKHAHGWLIKTILTSILEGILRLFCGLALEH